MPEEISPLLLPMINHQIKGNGMRVDGSAQMRGTIAHFGFACGLLAIETSIRKHDPEAGVWQNLAPMSTRRGAHSASAIAGQLYIVGGVSDDDQLLNTAKKFDPESGAWRNLAPMSRATIWFNLRLAPPTISARPGSLHGHGILVEDRV